MIVGRGGFRMEEDRHQFTDRFHLRMPSGTIDRLRELAYSENRSINNYLTNLILYHLDQKERKEEGE